MRQACVEPGMHDLRREHYVSSLRNLAGGVMNMGRTVSCAVIERCLIPDLSTTTALNAATI